MPIYCSIPQQPSTQIHSLWVSLLQEKGNIVCLWEVFNFFSFPVWFLPTCRIYMSRNPGFVFLPIMEGGPRQAAVMQHFHTACSVSSRWESSASVYKMFLWSEIQLLVGLVPQWDLALCYQFWKHWISKAAFTGLLCTTWSKYLKRESVKDMLLVFLGNHLGFCGFFLNFIWKTLTCLRICFCIKSFAWFTQGSIFPRADVKS